MELLDIVGVKARKLAYYGHTMRIQGLEKEIMQGTIPCARRRGRTYGLNGVPVEEDR